MNKTFILLLLLIASIRGQTFIQLGENLQIQSLSEIHQMDVEKLDCSLNLLQISQSIKAWQEILENEKELDTDIQSLLRIQVQVKEFRKLSDHRQIFAQIKTSIQANMREVGVFDLSPYQSWRQEGIEGLQGQLNLLDQARSVDESQACCDKIEKLIDKLLSEREKIKKECQQPQITINIINSKATQVSKTQEVCEGQGVIIKGISDKVPTKPENIPEQSESVSDSEDEDDVDTDAKKKISDVDREEPVQVREQQSTEPYVEYGYGFWARFLLQFPTRLPNGKDQPWYFVTRLTSNKNYDNIGQNDRILAIWLGKGYYHFTTSDSEKQQPNIIQNINYPDDIDGLWTYIYYSYSVAQKKAVALIKYGEEPIKSAVHNVVHPKINYLKFIIGGKDNGRYPAFNGVFQNIYVSFQQGVFKDSPDELQGVLQAQKVVPKPGLTNLIGYKLVTTPVQRDPKAEPVQQVVGGASVKFPQEYAFSGWFKWVPPKQQEDWHNVFRVQISQPSTDKFLGDRTLSLWVGKQDGGILHFPTYTYTSMEGQGNPNLFKNIPHKDRINNEWTFVYFGYSRPLRQARAYVQFKETEDELNFDKVNHFTVPKFYVFVGKDKHFPGFSGQIALAVFNIGEGAFKPGNDFKAPGDPFQYKIGDKKLKGEDTQTKINKPAVPEVDDGIVSPSSTNEEKPTIDQKVEKQEPFTEYGYGFWARYLTLFPTVQLEGKNQPWYFVSRLTYNINYQNTDMGDRTLAIWQGQGKYVFCTIDKPRNQPNYVSEQVTPTDIEGIWTYFYYSYSVAEKKAVAFTKFGESEPKVIVQQVTHPEIKFLRFILGGKDAGRYPGFNGLFTQVFFSTKEGAFIDKPEDLNNFIKQSIIPKQDLTQLYSHEIVDDEISRKPDDAPEYEEIGGGSQKFPHEYGISGWFKWANPAQQREWHNVFRVQVFKPSTDRYLGDRTLSLWVGTQQGGILHFPTYTYTSNNGAGNPNLVKNIQHKNRHLEWFFVYFGYSKNEKKAFVSVRFTTGIETIEYPGVNHYYAPQFYIYAGKDQQFPGFSGKLAYVKFNLGNGAFRSKPDFKEENDSFGFSKGEAALLKVIKPTEKAKPTETVDKDTGVKVQPSGVTDSKPKVDKEEKQDADLAEYGYGFYARFLTAYPTRLLAGKNAPWYFVARLTKNNPYGNIGLGDRVLAIWQGQGFYHFTTNNVAPVNVNQIKNINYPDDIEGLWTYFYYSYSVAEKKAVAFVKYGTAEALQADHATTHAATKYVRFILGGKDDGRYPGFNGQFSQVYFSTQPGVYIGTLAKLNEFVGKVPSPISKTPLVAQRLVDGIQNRKSGDPGAEVDVDVNLVGDYAISGWFNWEPTQQQVWHNLFRITLKKPSTDAYLGDRTLAGWLGLGEGGILHLTTYTYTNLNGAGTPNTPQNIAHKNRHLDWFYIYFGYSKQQKQAYAFVKWTNGENTLEFKNANHYLAQKLFAYVGKDAHFPGWSGRIAHVAFVTGDGAFKKGTDYTHPQDVFRFEKGTAQLLPKVDPSQPQVTDKKAELPSAFNNNAPVINKVVQQPDNLNEYGYGFWFRFLTAFPQRLIQGKNSPWYFVARLTVNLNYDNTRMGDRTLAIWQGLGFYHFTTCNTKNGNPNVIQNINFAEDIEGLWTYVYYSYSFTAKKAVAFIKYGKEDPKSITHSDIHHPVARQFRFILGGMDDNRYPAFNGIFTQVTYSSDKGTFIDSLDRFNLQSNQFPGTEVELLNTNVVDRSVDRGVNEQPTTKTVGDDKVKLPSEYAISGWFQWQPVQPQQPWHNIFRVQILAPSTDRFLGDRTLSLWLGNGILHFPTYTYTNLIGAGNANLHQNIDHKNRHLEWFFVYFGYSKDTKNAFAYVKWTQSENNLNYPNVNHYFAPKFYIFAGKDLHFPGFNGKIAYINFNIGTGSFKKGSDYGHPKDIFGFAVGQKELFKPVEPQKKPEPDTRVLESKHNENAPLVDKTSPESPSNLEEYGYGYWFRFLTIYPARLVNGKNQPWYFISRLTTNLQYENIRMGDRALAVWQGQGFYLYVTCNTQNNEANLLGKINYPDDIEGVWTYLYYSYSVKAKSSVGFIKYGNQDFLTVKLDALNPPAKQVRFVVGGNDDKRYPALNGIITSVYFNTQVGAYISSLEDIKKFLPTQGGEPSQGFKDFVSKPIVGDTEVTRETAEPAIKATVTENKLPVEYAISGWFRFKQNTQLQPWHTGFRVESKQPSTDNQVGDRVLYFQIGKDGGIAWLATYTYTNMNGGGQVSVPKSVPHNNRHFEWFFVYQGYSKAKNQAQAYIKWTKDDNSLEFPNVRHYLTPEFYISVGNDPYFAGWSGKIALVQFHVGEGSFKTGKDFADPKDAFKIDAAAATILKPKKEEEKPIDIKIEPIKADIIPDAPKPISSEKPVEIKKEEPKPVEIKKEEPAKPQPPKPVPHPNADTEHIPSKSSQDAPLINKRTEPKNLVEYGYGFWLRFLTIYPERLPNGKNEPWYFVSRLTTNEPYDNIRMGDRTLAIWQGQGNYIFVTCNTVNGNPNVVSPINYPADIEGIWTYIYYSYSVEAKQAVGFIKFGNKDFESVVQPITHPKTDQVRFVLGGNDAKRYPGFNGLFTRVVFHDELGAYISKVQDLQKLIDSQGPEPSVIAKDLISKDLVEGVVARDPKDERKPIQVTEARLPHEYAISGWFKFVQPTNQADWHSAFRVQVTTPATDNTLGDRVLMYEIGKQGGGIIWTTTYSYQNMNGAGRANIPNTVPHKDRHYKWHFVYQGYSKPKSFTYFIAKFTDSDESFQWTDSNHYYSGLFHIFLGTTPFQPGWSGQHALVSFHTGEGAFKVGKDYGHPQDAFKQTAAANTILKPAEKKAPPTADSGLLENKSTQDAPLVDKTTDGKQDLEEYGYGFWFRFLTVYPERLASGKNAPWYFVSRLTTNQQYDNIRLGDRALAIWQGQGNYIFVTCNTANGDPNVVNPVNYPEDIEGVWTYVYYSYSVEARNAVGFIKFAGKEFQVVNQKVAHPVVKVVRFIVGGNDQKRYPGLNGLFTRVIFNDQVGAYITKVEDLQKLVDSQGPEPSFTVKGLSTKTLVDDEIYRETKNDINKVTVTEKSLPHEYAISGWFRFALPVPLEDWHAAFRVGIRNPPQDNGLSDRTLFYSIGRGGFVWTTTYSYDNMNGGGSPNLPKQVDHKDRHFKWHFVYQGYSKVKAQAFFYVKFTDSEEAFDWPKVNHYFAADFFVTVGSDPFQKGWNGKLAYVNFNTGEGAFRTGKDFTHPKDVFGFGAGDKALINKAPAKPTDKPVDTNFYDSDSTAKKPLIDKEATNDKPFDSYGYGFWFRFLTVFPARLISGKNAPWYFISRITNQNPYDNIRMGDRVLAVWQGDGYYHFTTNNIQNGNVNQIINNNYPTDIEGLWTFLYYSYSFDDNEAIGLIKYGNKDIETITHKTVHARTKYIRFILGGNDNDRYPGFNGQFTQVTFATKDAFIKNAAELNEFLKATTAPATGNKTPYNFNLVPNPITRNPEEEPKFETIGGGEKRFPFEYAISGWYRWRQVAQQAWHNLFRVTIKNPSTDQFLGDRTLTCWLGLSEGGILHMPTYSYANMVGGGNTNLIQNIQHKDRHREWFFIYFGYSKTESQAFAYVKWTNGENSNTYDKVNHYFVPEFFVYVGKDKHFIGHSGNIAYVNFNLGDGSFKKGDYTNDKDSFGLKAGLDNLFKPVPHNPGEAEKGELSNAFDQKKPVIDKEVKSENFLEEYGYGFWLRFLTVYPKRLLAGKNEAWYFVSRLTSMNPYDNIRMNDRRLAIWQGAGYYHFTTSNSVTGNVNQIININFPEDIEGLWTYIYYSYSDQKAKSVGLIKYGTGDIQVASHDTSQEKTKYVRFILGGNDNDRYPGFNGIFTSVTFGTQLGTFIGEPKQLAEYLTTLGTPDSEIKTLTNTKLVDGQISRATDEPELFKAIGQEGQRFPHEYAISGWFRWQPTAQQAWHNFFRVQIKQPTTDTFLGDRTLTLWLGLGFLHFPTYTYVNMVGGGNTNYHQNINHKDRHLTWFFVYYGYSKKAQAAHIYVKWSDSEDVLNYEKINHYFAPEFFVYVGKDKFYPGVNGKIGYVNFNTGTGSFTKNFDHKDDVFGLKAGLTNLAPKKTEFEPTSLVKTLLPNAFNQDKPVVDQEAKSDQPFEEYGYGFWLRFLTVYPQRLVSGKNEAWYFVSRLTSNNPYDNIRMNDRTLAIWQGQGFYHFTACNSVDNNPNYIQNINFPEDIEGLWTYIYYSYSADQNKAVAFIKYGDGETQTAVHKLTQAKVKYLRFIVGGNDAKRYPGFNGVYTSVVFTTTGGAFVESKTIVDAFLEKNAAPSTSVKLDTQIIIEDVQKRAAADDHVLKTYTNAENPTFPREYAISGWYKWTPMVQAPWHNIFRVQIKSPPTDALLGDRTLCLWLGAGYLHLPTYTYTNMNGAGNTNWWQNIDHKERHTQWFYVYFGYSRIRSKAYAYVKWTSEENSLSYDKAKHYFSHQFYIYIGKDTFFTGFNGQQAQVRWNSGAGAFRDGNDFKDDKDIFGFSSFQVPGVPKFNQDDRVKDIQPLQVDNKKGTLTKEWDDLNGVKEYGYGFWIRYLARFPVAMKLGNRAPWSIIARLSKNADYGDARVGDRTLAVWLGDGFYHFTTYDGGNPNFNQNINHPADIEGLWTFIHFSHSIDKKKSVAFIKFGGDPIQRKDFPATHIAPVLLRYYLGRNDGTYPSYNGQVTEAYVSAGDGIFIENEDGLNAWLKTVKKPDDFNVDLKTKEIVPKVETYKTEIEPKEIVIEDAIFTTEYAWSGWFKWSQPEVQKDWHLMIRLSNLQASENLQFLGDRDLSAWVGRNILHFSTYTYTDQKANGNADIWKQIPYLNDLPKWHFVYFGYSKSQKYTWASIEFASRTPTIEWKDVNHYLPNKFSLYVAKDKWHSTYSGNIGYVRFNAGQGAFTKDGFDKNEKDIFGYNLGKKELIKPAPKLDLNTREAKVLNSPQDGKEPLITKEWAENDLESVTQYGYGYWFRFLTQFPLQLKSGRQVDWAFMSRLTNKKVLGDIGVGDRTLAVWSAKGFYHFTTYNAGNPNEIRNFNHPVDIEGVWSFLYFSHHLDKGLSVGILKIGNEKIARQVVNAKHTVPSFLKFYLGGNNMNYPAFNGQFSDIIVSAAEGIFLENEVDVEKLLETLKKPEDFNNKLQTIEVIPKSTTYLTDIQPKEVSLDTTPLPSEYAWSGWFKWTPTVQQPWHLAVRLTIHSQSENMQFLGDRTLNMWVGSQEGGILHFCTYNYENMFGAGNVNWWQNVKYEADLARWHFVYFGYSFVQKLALAKVEFAYNRVETREYKGAKHYLPNKFYMYVAKDKWHATYSGIIGYLRFNTGAGAFSDKPFENQPAGDIFGYVDGKKALVPESKEPPIDELAKQEMILSSFNGKIQLEKEFKEDALGADLQEYGYGFYIRYLTQYPTQMLAGKPEAWYIIARLTKNEKYADVGMGDRLLAVWQGQAIYLPVTNDLPGNPNFHQTVPYGDIEGVWTFIYFSYSLTLQKATFLLKYDGNDEIFKRDFKCNHGAITYLKFIVGGASPPYQGFNGQIANTAIKFGQGAYIDDYSKWLRHLNNRIPRPPADDNSLKSVDILKGVDEVPFKADKTAPPYGVWAIETESIFQSEYSVTGWIRWEVPPVGPWYNVWRLSLYKEEDNLNAARLGDRDHTLFKHSDYYHFTSYTYANLNGAGDANVWQNIPHGSSHLQWHFIFSGYSRKLRQMQHHITFIDEQKEIITPNINHYVLYRHYFHFGKDFKKWEGIHNGFQGFATKIQLNYGEGAYQVKPFDKPDALFYSAGKKKYHPSFDFRQVTPPAELKDPIPASANQDKPIFDIQLEAKDNIRGLQEYGWTTWVRWLRTGPTNLIWMAPPHLIGRLTINKNHQDGGLGDRTLSCWQVAGQYHFRTYTPGNNDVAINVGYKVPDGSWNLISWTYKKNSARSIVYMNGKDIDNQEVKVVHQPVGEFLRFVSLKEFAYRAFNGFYAKVSLRLGDGAYIDEKQFQTLLTGELKLPEALVPSQTRKTVALQKDQIQVKHEQVLPDIIIPEDIVNGKDEYSVSGWAKYVDTAPGPWNLVIRVSTNAPAVLDNLAAPGDRTFGIWKGEGYYHFCTYTSDQENGGAWAIAQNSDYQGLLHKNWVYFYFGYSRTLKKAFAYVKYVTKEDKLVYNVLHQVPYKFTIQLKKDKWHNGFQGAMENWYLNVGAGSYKESGYEVGEQGDQTFGFGGRVRPPIKQWQSLDLFEQRWGPEKKVGIEVEYKNDDSINGLQEYGYGFWFRFVWNGPNKLVDKPAWLALARLTINENYEGDARAAGDRQLAVWVGSPYFHFTTSQAGNANVWNNVNYNQMLDGQWNLLYYGYKRTEKGGKVLGHILFDGQSLRSTEFPVVNQFPVQDYLYFSVGSSGTKLLNNYFSFNGQIAGVKLVLGDGGLIETSDELKKFGGNKPVLPKIPQVKKTIFEDQQDMKRDQGQVAPVEFKDEFAGADEYVISIWFKWSTIGRVAWEVIYSLTYNEPALRANHVRPGDRVLSMYQYADHRIFFSSYSTPDSHDTFAQVYTECPVPVNDQTGWVYGYYTYSRKSASLVSYLKTRTTDCEKKIAAMHRVPGYFGLYVGKDGIHTPYNGKFAHLYLWAGEGSYREKDYLSFQPYLAGASGIQTKPYKYTDKNQPFDLAFDQDLNIDFEVEKVNGQSAYGYGFWAKYLTAYPKRLLVKPQWLELIRFTIVKDNKDNTNLGDRALAIWVGAGYYHFTTYNQANNLPSINQNVDYGDQLEGQWNFIYFSYSTARTQATGFVKFGISEEVKRVTFTPISHRPIEDFARIHLGKEFQYQGFNGQISGLIVTFGGIGYIHDTDGLEAAIKSSFPIPEDKPVVATKLALQDAERVKAQNEAPQYTEWPDQYKFSQEYSIFGWFRYDAKELATPNNVLMRLTNNEPAYRKEFGQVGDRTLIAMLQAREYAFATYTLGKIDTDSVANIRKAIPYGNNYGLWTYVWVGYSWPKRQASAIVKFQTGVQTETFTEVLHMVPKFLAFFVGSDGMLGGWIGPIAKVSAIFGKGAYVDPSKGNFEANLPDVSGVNSNPQFEWKPEKEGIQQVPKGKDPGYDIVLKDQVKGISEYGYGLWTRWLMTTPERVPDKAPFNHLIRLTNTEKYEDNVELGNRVLAIWVGKGYYHFTTYNKAQNKVSISQNVDYSDYLEGHWNYIYFSFTTRDGKPRAVGFVLFGDLPGEQIQRVEFVDITHTPINGYARITVANNEFSYPAFNGMIADVRLFFGKGFVGSKEQFQKEIISQYPKPNFLLPKRTDINVLKDKKEFVKDDEKAAVKGYYDQYQGVIEYAVSGWFQSKRSGSVDQLQTIFRLTINAPEFLKDKANAGDRTLTAFSTRQKYILSTYDYGNLDTNDDDQNELNKDFNIGSNGADWTFLYFGYNYKERKAFGYALYYTREDSAQYNDLKHFVPNKFWFYLGGGDKFNPGFEGTLYNWNLHLGDGAFSNKPKTFIEVWPYEPKDLDSSRVLSALLGNQGLSSVKITKTGPVSGQIDSAKGPVSGQVEKVQGPISGQIDKGAGAASGQIDKGAGAASGQIDKGAGAASGQIVKGAGADSGQIDKGAGAASGQLAQGQKPLSGQQQK